MIAHAPVPPLIDSCWTREANCTNQFCRAVPSQPTNLDASEIGENSVKLQWSKPVIAGDHLTAYDLYWNDTYTKVSNGSLEQEFCKIIFD